MSILTIDKTKFSCLPAGRGGRIKIYIAVVIIVLSAVNIYLLLLRKSIVEFISEEAMLSNERAGKIREFRR